MSYDSNDENDQSSAITSCLSEFNVNRNIEEILVQLNGLFWGDFELAFEEAEDNIEDIEALDSFRRLVRDLREILPFDENEEGVLVLTNHDIGLDVTINSHNNNGERRFPEVPLTENEQGEGYLDLQLTYVIPEQAIRVLVRRIYFERNRLDARVVLQDEEEIPLRDL